MCSWRRFAIRDGPRNLEGHFGADTGACPDVEGGADSSCALLHAADPPVPGASASFEQGWIVRKPHQRAVRITEAGAEAFAKRLGVVLEDSR